MMVHDKLLCCIGWVVSADVEKEKSGRVQSLRGLGHCCVVGPRSLLDRHQESTRIQECRRLSVNSGRNGPSRGSCRRVDALIRRNRRRAAAARFLEFVTTTTSILPSEPDR